MNRISGPVFVTILLLAGCQSPPFQSVSKGLFHNRSGSRQSGVSGSEALSGHLADGKSFSSKSRSGRLGSILPVSGRSAEPSARETRTLLGEAHAAYAARRFEEARSLYEKVLKKDPDNGSAHHRLAIIADRNRDYGTAERHYRLALQQLPGNADLLSDIGFSYFMQGRYKESEHYLKEALAINRNHTKALYNLGYLYGKQGDARRAYELFRQAGSEENARALMARLFPQGFEGGDSRDTVGRDSRGRRDFREHGDFSVSAPQPGRGNIAGGATARQGDPSESFRDLQDRMRRAREEAIARRRARNRRADAGAGRVTPWNAPSSASRDVSFRPNHPETDYSGSGGAGRPPRRDDRSAAGIPPQYAADNRWQNGSPADVRGSRFPDRSVVDRQRLYGNDRSLSSGQFDDSRSRIPDNHLNDAMRRIDRDYDRGRYQLFPAGGDGDNRRDFSRGTSPAGDRWQRGQSPPGTAGRTLQDGSSYRGTGSFGGEGSSSRRYGNEYGAPARSRLPDSAGYGSGIHRPASSPADGEPPSNRGDRLLWPPAGSTVSPIGPRTGHRVPYGTGAPDGNRQMPGGYDGTPAAGGQNPPRYLPQGNPSSADRHRDALRLGHNTGTGVLFPVPGESDSRNLPARSPNGISRANGPASAWPRGVTNISTNRTMLPDERRRPAPRWPASQQPVSPVSRQGTAGYGTPSASRYATSYSPRPGGSANRRLSDGPDDGSRYAGGRDISPVIIPRR